MIIIFKKMNCFQFLSTLALATVLSTLIDCKTIPVPRKIDISPPFIIGGHPSVPGAWPWMVAIDSAEYGFICGGALIDRYWAITAAHCVDGAPIQLYANIGQYNLTAKDYVERIAVDIIVHPNNTQSSTKKRNDIALLKLTSPATLDHPNIEAVTLPDEDERFHYEDLCTSIGWGRVVPGNTPISDILMERNVSVLSNFMCQLKWAFSIFIPTIHSTNICIDEGDGAISTCQGDSGSPLQCYDPIEDEWILAGVSSWGSAACHTYPSVFIRVSSFRQWIDFHIEN